MEEHLRAVEKALGRRLPAALRAVYLDGDGRYQPDGQWWVVWPLDRLVKENRYGWQELALDPELLAFGDNGADCAFCVPFDGSDDVVRWYWIATEREGSEGTMRRFLDTWAVPD